MPINIDELLSELEGAEKTAEDSFIDEVTKTEEKVAESTEVDETAETEEKVAEEVEETKAEEAETEEKVEESTETEATAEKKDKQDAQRAMDMGRIAAHTFYSELVALGIMPPTNKDMVVPPISTVSLPSESPVTVAADAAYQEAAGHDAYDVRRQMNKKASKITPGVLQELYNKIYPED